MSEIQINQVTLEDAFEQGVTAYQNGNLSLAVTIFSDILKQEPNHITILQALSTVYTQQKEYLLAENLINQAIEIAPDNHSLQFDLAQLLFFQKRNQLAWTLLNRLDHEFPNSEQILELKQKVAQNLKHKKEIKIISNQLKQIENRKKEIIQEEINETITLAKKFILEENWEQAELLLQAVISADSKLAGLESYQLLAQTYKAQNQLNKAFDLYQSIVKQIEQVPLMFIEFIQLTIQLEQYEQAKTLALKGIKRFPNEVSFSYLLMISYQAVDQWQAIYNYMGKYYLKDQSDLSTYFYLLANYKQIKSKQNFSFETLIKSIDQLALFLERTPDNFLQKVNLRSNLSEAYMLQGKAEEALILFDELIEIEPKYSAIFTWNKTRCYKQLHQWSNFYQAFEYGIIAKQRGQVKTPHPQWSLERPKTDHVLVLPEQGIGDEIRFLLNLPLVIDNARAVTLICEARLVPLLTVAFPQITINGITKRPSFDEPMPLDLLNSIDSIIFMGSLGKIVYEQYQRHQYVDSYIKTAEQIQYKWHERITTIKENYASKNGFKKPFCFGICWRSSLRDNERNVHYMDIKEIGFLLTQLPEAIFVNLQYDDCSDEIALLKQTFNIDLINFDDLNLKDDFVETAALIEQLDGVITAGTAIQTLSLATSKTPVYLFSAMHHKSDYKIPFRNEWQREIRFEYPPLIESKIPVVNAMAKVIREDFNLT